MIHTVVVWQHKRCFVEKECTKLALGINPQAIFSGIDDLTDEEKRAAGVYMIAQPMPHDPVFASCNAFFIFIK